MVSGMEQVKPTSPYTGASGGSRGSSIAPGLPRSILLQRPKTPSLAVHVARVKPVTTTTTTTTTTTAAVAMSYDHRAISPGGRRVQAASAARLSDQTLTDHGYYTNNRHNSYASPRSSTGVIPISTQTFINLPPPQPARPSQQYDSYSGRPRRSSLVDTSRMSAPASIPALPSRSRPSTLVMQDLGRPSSPPKSSRASEYYVTPASSQDSRSNSTTTTTTTTTHKKLYSVDGDGGAKLVADVNIPVQVAGDRHHRRRESTERGGYRTGGIERDRGRRGATYHTNGHTKSRDKSIDDEDAYSYTDPASMYRDTEPRWRDVRPRRGSVDRGGASSRERPVVDTTFGPRQSVKEFGPPPSTRGWDRINDTLGRTRSVRDEPRQVAQSPTRGRNASDYPDPRDKYQVQPRASSNDRRAAIHHYESYDYDREPRKRERRNSVTRDNRFDQSVERRGFGIRPESQTRHGARSDARGSDDSFERDKYRDSGYLEQPIRRDTAPELHARDAARLEQEMRDRELAQRIQAEERERERLLLARDSQTVPAYAPSHQPVAPTYQTASPHQSAPLRRRDDDRGYDRDHDRARDREYERDRERERERVRQTELPLADREKERHHHRRDTDRDRKDSKEGNSEFQSKPSLSGAATGGLAGAAAAFGLTGLLNKVTDKRDKDRDRDDDKDRDRDREREREREREKERERHERRDDDRDRRESRAASDEHPHDRERERDRVQKDIDRGLGFAFEAPPDLPRSVAPEIQRERSQERSLGRAQDQHGRSTERLQERPPDRPLDRPQVRVSDHPQERSQDRPPERPRERSVHDSNTDRMDRERERERNLDSKNGHADMPAPMVDADEDYRRRMEQVQRDLGIVGGPRPTEDARAPESDPDRQRRRRDREQRQRERESRNDGSNAPYPDSRSGAASARPQRSFERDEISAAVGTTVTHPISPDLHRKPSILDRPMVVGDPVQIIDNSYSDKRENRVRIVDPPTEEEDKKPKGILKRPTEKFPEDPNCIREGVAPLKDATKKGIPPGARWTKIDRRLVNPEALEAAHERFEERLDCVIVLRVLTKEEIQKLADKTRQLRGNHHSSHPPPLSNGNCLDQSCADGSSGTDHARKAANSSLTTPPPDLEQLYEQLSQNPPPLVKLERRDHDAEEARKGQEERGLPGRRRAWTSTATQGIRNILTHSLTRNVPSTDSRHEESRSERKAGRRKMRNRDEYDYSDSEDEFKEKAPKMLEAPLSTAGASNEADFIRENQRRQERGRDSDANYMSGGLGTRRDDHYRDESRSRY